MTAGTPSPLVPKLRFPAFRDAGEWEAKPLNDLCDRLTETVGDSQLTPVSISAGKGFVPQAEKFGRNIAGSQYRKYIRLQRGEFAYNRGNSKQFPQGCVYQLTEFDEVAASNAFYCFRLYDHLEPAFVLGFFEKNEHGRQLIRHITSGARSNGLLNINADTFFGITVPTPREIAEQQRIADCLSSLDELIAAQAGKLDALRRHKKGLMQKLFPQQGQTVPELRFPEFRDAPYWKTGHCRDIARVLPGCGFPDKFQGNKNGQYPFYKVSDISLTIEKDQRYISKANNYINSDVLDEIRGKPVPTGTIIFAKIGEAIRLNRRVVTTKPAMIDNNTAGVKAINTKSADEFLLYLWSNVSLSDHAGGVVPAVSKSALENVPLCYPSDPEEQQRIADCLSCLDDLIAAQARKLDALRTHKQGLLQQLFPTLEGNQP